MGSIIFWTAMGLGLVIYGISRITGYHFCDELKDEPVDWTPWEDIT